MRESFTASTLRFLEIQYCCAIIRRFAYSESTFHHFAKTVNPEDPELRSLQSLVQQLIARVEQLERRAAISEGRAPVLQSPVTPEAKAAAPPLSPIPPQLPSPPVPALPPSAAFSPPAKGYASSADLESRIGSQLLNRIGIAALLIGVSYFLKFAFDNNWIGPAGRISIGLLSGIAVIAWSERFRERGYKIFSYSLNAVGVGVLYLSLWAAFQVYHLIPSGLAFLAMILVTASTAALAIRRDAELMAAISLTGGFITPWLLSTGQNHEVELFTYTTLLTAASAATVYVKRWERLLALSYFGSLLLYCGWYAEYYNLSEFAITFTFATIFFLIFLVVPLLCKAAEGRTYFWQLMWALTLINTSVYFLETYSMVEDVDKKAMAWLALALAVLHVGLSQIFNRRASKEAQSPRLLHLALAVCLTTIAVAIQFEGYWITVGWLVEGGALLWVAERIHSRLLHTMATVAVALGVVRVLLIDDFAVHSLLFNARIATYVLAIAVLAILAWFSLQGRTEADRQIAGVAVVAINALALIALSLEIRDYFSHQLLSSSYDRTWTAAKRLKFRQLTIEQNFSHSALWMGYGALLMLIGFWRKSAFFRWQALFLIAATIVKVFIWDVSQLDRGYRILSFMILGILLLTVSFVYQKDWLKLSKLRTGELNRN
jgi:uncharacterized membrane protein